MYVAAVRYLSFVLSFAIAGSFLLPGSAYAVRGKNPVLFQVTFNTEGDVYRPGLHLERAESVVFTSDGDVMGPGSAPGHREVYIWDAASRVTSRATTTVGGESYAGSRVTDEQRDSGRPQYLAFVSTGDLDQSVGNADGNPEVFLWEVQTGIYHQLTDTLAPVVNKDPFPSDSGRCIVFSSNADLDNNDGTQDDQNPPTHNSNPDGSEEVFLYSITQTAGFPFNGTFTQLSDGPAGTSSHSPTIGGFYFPVQCQSTVYISDHDQLGHGAVGDQIYRWDRKVGVLSHLVDNKFPLDPNGPHPPGIFGRPAISSASNFARGPYVVFHTDSDIWHNASTGFNMFRYRAFHLRMTQYTDLDVGDVRNPVIGDGGGFIAFESNGDMVDSSKRVKRGSNPPFNADGNYEIYRMKKRRKIVQLTRSENCENVDASIEDNGGGVAFRSTCDLIPGLNPNNIPQIFFRAQVQNDNPLLVPANCVQATGCCSEQNGCYERIEGRTFKVTKKNCLNKPSGCP